MLAYVTPQIAGLRAAFNGPGPFHGALSSYSSGAFQYTPGINYTGQDTFTYQAMAGTMVSNTATVTITIVPPTLVSPPRRLLPDTSYYNYLRKRRSIDPPRFDYYHPKIGALIGLEITGIPSTPTTIVPVNKHFNAAAERKLYLENPQQFDRTQAVLGALFQLETPGPGNTNLLPDTPYYIEQEAQYHSNPTAYQLKNPYLGAIFAIESIEQGGAAVPAAASAHASSSELKGSHAQLGSAQSVVFGGRMNEAWPCGSQRISKSGKNRPIRRSRFTAPSSRPRPISCAMLPGADWCRRAGGRRRSARRTPREIPASSPIRS